MRLEVLMPTRQYSNIQEKGKYLVTRDEDTEGILGKWKLKLKDKMFNYLVHHGYLSTSWLRVPDPPTIQAINIDLDELDRLIAENKSAIMTIHEEEVDLLICGRDIMNQIIRNSAGIHGQSISVGLNGPSRYARYMMADEPPQNVYYRGLEVRLVPWFHGMLLIKGDKPVHTPHRGFDNFHI